MQHKPKVYLDTSVISAYFDKNNPERMEMTKDFFSLLQFYDPFISSITKGEIDETPDMELRDKMNEIIEDIPTLTIDEDVEKLANKYIESNAFPEKYRLDAYHVAIAVINGMDYVLSWNFKHLVKIKTRAIVNEVNTSNRYRTITIITPAELS